METRALFSVAPATPMPLGWDGPATNPASEMRLGFDEDTTLWEEASTALGDVTPTGTSYMLYDYWGGSWCDAEKTLANTEDDMMCWAAAASNVLAWTGWGNVQGMTNSDQVFAYFQNHWTDEGGLMEFGWDWWFDGGNDSQGWSNWSQVDVAGGGFYPSENFDAYFHSSSNEATALASIDSYLHSGYGVTMGIYGPGGHAITVWGYNYDTNNPSNYLGLWITDSDDASYLSNPPDQLRYYEVAYNGSQWFLQDFYGSDAWYIGTVQGLAPKNPTPVSQNEIHGSVWEDANGDGQHQAGESGLAGETVYLDYNNNGTLDVGNTTTFSTNTPKSILDLTTITSMITVSGASRISDLNVALNITHTYDSDLTAYLISPDGTKVLLFDGVGSNGDNFTGTVLDDSAGDDTFVGKDNWSQLSGDGFFYRARRFETVYGYAGSGGYDQCYLNDMAGVDHLDASGSQAVLTCATGAVIDVNSFAWVSASGSYGQNTKRVATIDYLLETSGVWVDV